MRNRVVPRRAWRAALLVVGAAVLAACSTPVPSEAELTEAFEVSGFSPEVASCASASLLDNLSDEDLILLLERGGGGAPEDDPDDDDDAADRVREALVACRALEADPTTTTVPIGGAVDSGDRDSLPGGGTTP